MPKIPGFPEKPHYNSVKAYLSELAKDIAEIVVDPVKMERFREQLKIYADFWKQWSTFDEADRQGCWMPSMGKPEYIFKIFSRSYNPLRDTEKEAKILAGSYALCALMHDSQLPHLDKINTDIIPVEAVEETLSAPRNTLEARIVGNWNSGPDVREIYLIEEFFNRVTVDLQEFCKSEENKLTQASIEGQIQQESQLSDEELLELTAKKFEERAKKVLSKDETWHDLDRSLKVWFDAAIERLEKHGFKNKTDLLKYLYKNLLHYARGINIKNFRGFPDSRIVELAYNNVSELAERFKEVARKNKENLPPKKTEENESGVIVDLLKKDYLLTTEDSLKQKTAQIVQDFISRGLYNSTACTSKQLQAHFDHINKLLDHILESLKKDFADIPLKQIKEKLLTITDEEYKRLVPIANSHLVNAGLAQPDMLKSFEQQINNKKKKVKQTIETRLAISEKQREKPKDKRDLAGTEQRAKNGGDTYVISDSNISFGDKAQHAGRDINTITPEPEKEKGEWGLFKKIGLFLGIIVSLIVIVEACNKYVRKDRPAVKQIETPKTETKTTVETKTSDGSSPEIITESPVSGIYYLKAEKLLNDDDGQNGDEVYVQLFIGEEVAKNIHLTFEKEKVVKKLELDKFKEKFVTMRLCIKDKKRKKNEIEIGSIEHIDFKENATKPIIFEGGHGWLGKVRYSLTYKISQKERN